MTAPLTAAIGSYQSQANELRRALTDYTDEQLRDWCAEQARQYTDAMFRLGAIDENGTVTGAMPKFRPGPHVIPEVLVGMMTGEHVGAVMAWYHRASQGNVREMLSDLADWAAGVSAALESGETVPLCLHCGEDHTPQS